MRTLKTMTVAQLRRALAKMPQDAVVVWRDQDQSLHECSGQLHYVEECPEIQEADGRAERVVVLGP